MAEFTEVMRQAERMCKAQKVCSGCNLEVRGGCAFNVAKGADYAAVEKNVMNWAQAHPEPTYPSWYDWQKSNFPNAKVTICPMVFGCECKYVEAQCPECVRKPIPAEIARKLGIAPNVKKNEGR